MHTKEILQKDDFFPIKHSFWQQPWPQLFQMILVNMQYKLSLTVIKTKVANNFYIEAWNLLTFCQTGLFVV